ncbi:MAG: thiamine pyrophosphate-binding protein [Deltaproteobacteria bacterium]|nr:thiamine pyrophosphate-binding protein [Deltaproteobacteria bacterium]
MAETVIEHVLGRLKILGIKDVFGVPGDYAFAVNDAVCNDNEMRWIGCCNELNAAYAADGYARIRGFSALSTTFGVGELSALCGIAGSFTEHLPIFHIVGMPNTRTQQERRIVHHTLGTGQFDLFAKMTEPAVCASAILTPENAVTEMERVVNAALTHRRPVYLAIPDDYARMTVLGTALPPATLPSSVPDTLDAAVNAIIEKLEIAQIAVILAGYLICRLDLRAEAQALIEATGLPFATMTMDKTALDETHSQFMGMYIGRDINPEIRQFIENCDCVLNLGALWSDLNTVAYTAVIEKAKMIAVGHHSVRVGHAVYPGVEMKDLIDALVKKIGKKSINAPKTHGLSEPEGKYSDRITPEYLYPRWERFFKPDDIVIAETGTTSMGLECAMMPKGAVFHNQALWASIGWATPAAFGAALAAPERRTILITGEGAHQLTAQEVSQFGRFGLKPVIFCLNNDGYLIERLLCREPMTYYNDLAQWNYAKLPEALGCTNWFTAKVTTNAELEEAMNKAEMCNAGVYIEVIMDKMAGPPVAMKMHESFARK